MRPRPRSSRRRAADLPSAERTGRVRRAPGSPRPPASRSSQPSAVPPRAEQQRDLLLELVERVDADDAGERRHLGRAGTADPEAHAVGQAAPDRADRPGGLAGASVTMPSPRAAASARATASSTVLHRELRAEVDRVGTSAESGERRHLQSELVALARRRGEDDAGTQLRHSRRNQRGAEERAQHAAGEVLGGDAQLVARPAIADLVDQRPARSPWRTGRGRGPRAGGRAGAGPPRHRVARSRPGSPTVGR